MPPGSFVAPPLGDQDGGGTNSCPRSRAKPTGVWQAATATDASTTTMSGWWPLRERCNAATQFGVGKPSSPTFHSSGSSAIGNSSSSIRRRSHASISWCRPTRRAGKRPDRIQRRTVSGFLPIFSAASATDSIWRIVGVDADCFERAKRQAWAGGAGPWCTGGGRTPTFAGDPRSPLQQAKFRTLPTSIAHARRPYKRPATLGRH